jgi:NPCBM/NEW2 domain-containing protein
VTIGGQRFASALSTHPPARMRFALPAGCARLRCRVALNDDVAGRASHATFTVLADGRVVAEAPHVRAGAAPVPLVAELAKATVPGLLVSTTVLYSVARVIPAERFVCLDADMLVPSPLDILFAAVEASPPRAILVCGEGNDHGIRDLAAALDIAYGGGTLPGGSTAALASGLAARADGPWETAIASYELFRVEEYTLAEFAAYLPDPTVGTSFRPVFDANIAPWARHIEVREGDACAIGWSGEPIEVLFLDMVKTWQVNDLVLAQSLPCLMPGRSVIVQQGYLWGSCHWIHLTMELLDGSVERLDAMAKGSVAYLLTAPVPPDLIGVRLAEYLEPDHQRQLMDRAVERWQGDERGLVELARAMMIAELDGKPSGLAELNAVMDRHIGSVRVEQCAAIVSQYLR